MTTKMGSHPHNAAGVPSQHSIQFRLLAEAVENIAVLFLDPCGNIADWNSSAARLFGYSKDEVTGQSLSKLWFEGDPAGLQGLLDEAATSGAAKIVSQCVCRDGSTIPAIISVHADWMENRTLQGYGVLITPRVAAPSSESRYKRFVDQASDAFFLHDLDGRILDVNPRACESLGFCRHELLGMLVTDVEKSPLPEDLRDIWSRIPLANMVCFKGMHRRKDGSTFPVEVHVSKIDYNGQPALLASARDITERVRAEKELEKSEKRYRSLIRAFSQGVWITDATGEHYRVEDTLAQLPEQPGIQEGEAGLALFHPDDRERVRVTWAKAWASKSPFECDGRNITTNGDYLHVSIRAVPILDKNGEIEEWIGTSADVTEKKRVEQSLEDSVRRYRQLADAMPHLVWTTDPFGNLLFQNKKSIDTVGDFCRFEWFSRVHPDDRFKLEDDWRHSLETGEPHESEFRLRHSDSPDCDDYRWYLGRAVPIFDDGGKLVEWCGTATDIHAQRHASEKLYQTTELLHAVTNGTTDAVFVKDLQGRYLLFNPAASRFSGVAEQDVLGKDDTVIFDAPTAERIMARDRRVIESDQPLTIEEPIVFKGEKKIFLATKAPCRDRNGRVIGVIGISRDITERISANEALRESEQRFRQIADALDHVFWVICLAQKRVVYVSPAYERVWGQSAEQLYDNPRNWLDAIHVEDRERAFQGFRNWIDNPDEMPYDVSYRVVRADGKVRWIADRGTVIRNAEGHVYRLAGIARDVTDHKLAEEQLQRQRAEMQLLLDMVPALIFFKDRDHRIVRVNEEALRITGLPREAIEGKTEQEIGVPHYELYYRDDDEVWASQNAKRGIVEPLETNRGTRWLQTDKIPYHDSSGAMIGIVGFSVDITERLEMEQALRVTEERFRLLLEGATGHAIFMLDTNGKILTWNSGAEAIDGYKAHEVIGKGYEFHFTPEEVLSRTPYRELTQAAVAGKLEIEGWRVRKDGSLFWVNGVLTALYDPSGILRGYSVVIRDLTEKRRTDSLLRSVLEHATDAIVSINDQGEIISFNRAAEKIFHYRDTEILGRNFHDLIPDCDYIRSRGSTVDYLHQSVDSPHHSNMGLELLGRRKDYTAFPIELSVNEFELDGKRHFIGIIRDLSEKKKLESQLRQSQKMEAVGQLAGGIAHDFNNLLTIISGYSEIVLSTLPESEDAHQSVKAISEAASRAASLTRQLLAFSRRTVLEPKVLDLNSVVLETDKLLRRLIGENILLNLVLAPQPRSIRIDPGQLSQVLINLAVNSRDAMPRGGNLTIETANVLWDPGRASANLPVGEYVCLTFRDDGIGMSSEIMRHIFEPFFTTKGVGHGTGLGLAVVHGVIKQSGGEIECDSQPGVGTTFRIYFPVVEQTPAKHSLGDEAEALLGTETILLVEDEECVRSLAQRVLQSHRYVVHVANDGADAMRFVRNFQGHIDLLVTDVVMPHLGGSELALAIREHFPAIKVMFMSGYTDDAVIHLGSMQEGIHFLQKPYSPRNLAKKVREVLDGMR